MKALLVLALVASCGAAQVSMLGPRQPARAAGCPVQLVPGTPAPPFVDLAAARVRCVESARGDCLEALRRQTCAAGGDLAYGLSESLDQHIIYVSATLALRGPAVAAPVESAPGAGACTPICSPGFDCQAGRCVPLCNPACDPSEICNKHRTCEPAPPP